MSVAHKTSGQVTAIQGWRGGASARVAELLDRGIEEGIIRGATVLGSKFGQYTVQMSKGTKVPHAPQALVGSIDFNSVFDLGSLTEVVCTTTLMMQLISTGKVGLADRASRYIQSLAIGQKSHITIAHLLSHSAGFGTSAGIYDEIRKSSNGPRPGLLCSAGARNYAYRFVGKLSPRSEPGSKRQRSALSFILLGEICEVVTGMPLERAFSKYVAAPLELRSLNFVDITTLRAKSVQPKTELFAPVSHCSLRGRTPCGEVRDENTWAMGGVSGSNGLFGTAYDLLVWGCEVLAALKGRSNLIQSEVARDFLASHREGSALRWRLGFDDIVDHLTDGSIPVSPEAVACVSDTGCSIIIEPKRDLVGVVLTSGAAVDGSPKRVAGLRAQIHSALLETE